MIQRLDKRLRTGLVIGKFAPIHKGHQLLIDLSRGENDHTFVVCYNDYAFDNANPRLTKELRASWIEHLYPDEDVTVIIGHFPPYDMEGPTGNMIHASYVMGLVNNRVDRMYGSESYIYDMAHHMSAEPRIIDSKRVHIPVSATEIRSGLKRSKEFVDEWVMREYSKLWLIPTA